MYRILRESYKNYVKSFSDLDSYYLRIMEPFDIISNLDDYKKQQEEETKAYMELSDLLYSLRDCRKCQFFLDQFRELGITGYEYGILDYVALADLHDIIHSLLRLEYWKTSRPYKPEQKVHPEKVKD